MIRWLCPSHSSLKMFLDKMNSMPPIYKFPYLMISLFYLFFRKRKRKKEYFQINRFNLSHKATIFENIIIFYYFNTPLKVRNFYKSSK